jgi:iron(III) transport system permease protein
MTSLAIYPGAKPVLGRVTLADAARLVLLAAVIFLTLYPLLMVALASFNTSAIGTKAVYGLAPWRTVLGDPATWSIFWNTFVIAVPRTLLAIFLAASFAWLLARTNVPCRGAIIAALTFLFFLPDLPWIIAWMMMGAARVGLLNKWLSVLLGMRVDLINVFSMTGLIVLGAARAVPVLFLFLYPAFMAMDGSLEEAARVGGANRWKTFWRINFPLVRPALFAVLILAFVRSMESFELEQLIGVQAGIYVVTTRIYDLGFSTAEAKFGPAMATSLLLVAATLLLVLLQFRVVGKKTYETVSGRGFKAQRLDLGGWRWAAFAYVMAFLVIMGVLPFVVLLLNSFMPVYGYFTLNLLTTRHWARVLADPAVMLSIKNTLLMSVAAAFAAVTLCGAIAYVIARTRWPLRRPLEMAAWVPWAVPGLVMSLGYLWAYVSLPIYGTVWLLIMVFVARGLPIATQQLSTTFVQIGAELEESARVHGASWLQTVPRVWLPLLRPAFFSAWILIFVLSVRSLDSVLVLATADTRMLSVDIFAAANGGQMEMSVVLALIQTLVIIGGCVVARLLMGRLSLERASSAGAV